MKPRILDSSGMSAPSESLVQWLGVTWSLSSTIQLVAAIVGIATLLFIAYQSYLSRRSSEAVALQMRYAMILETNRFVFDNPEHLPFAVRGERYEAIKSMSIEERKRQAAQDLILDNFEFYFLIGCYENRIHADRLLREFLRNPEIRAYLDSPTKGIFRREFEEIVADELSRTSRMSADTRLRVAIRQAADRSLRLFKRRPGHMPVIDEPTKVATIEIEEAAPASASVNGDPPPTGARDPSQ